MSLIGAVLREAWVSTLSQRVTSLASVTMIAGMCLAVLLTAGRTVGSEQAIISSIDAAGSRSIVVRADPDAGLTTTILDRLRNVDGIEWSGAFEAADDVNNAAIPGSAPVPARRVYSSNLQDIGLPKWQSAVEESAYASSAALEELQMPEAAGGLSRIEDGADLAMIGNFEAPDFLAFLEPIVFIPKQVPANAEPSAISLVVVGAERPDLIAPIAEIVGTMIGVEDTTKVTMQTSGKLVELRAVIESQLTTFSRTLILVILSVTSVLVAAVQFGLVMLRRKDFGRRRALGATRFLIVSIVLLQVGIQSLAGALVGTTVSVITIGVLGDPQPPWNYFLGIAILATFTGLAAAAAPAIAASRRDPLQELRVP